MCTFNNYKDAGEWIDSRYRTADYHVVPCEMQIVTDSPVPVKGVQFMTVYMITTLGKGPWQYVVRLMRWHRPAYHG